MLLAGATCTFATVPADSRAVDPPVIVMPVSAAGASGRLSADLFGEALTLFRDDGGGSVAQWRTGVGATAIVLSVAPDGGADLLQFEGAHLRGVFPGRCESSL